MRRITNFIYLPAFAFLILVISCQKRLDKAALDLDETLGGKPSSNTSRTITGQGSFIDFDVKGTYTTNGTKTYQYDPVAAATYFTHNDGALSETSPFNQLSGASGSVVTKTRVSTTTTLPDPWNSTYFGGTATTSSSYTNPACTPPNPGAPGAPAKDAAQLDGIVSSNACSFLNGGNLSGTSYTKSLTSSTQSCSTVTKIYYRSTGGSSNIGWWVESTAVYGTYTYTYNYTITPNQASVSALTAWEFVSENLNGPTIPVQGFISRLQANSKQNPDGSLDLTSTKYTFNIESQQIDPITGLTTWVSNISDIKVEILDAVTFEVIDTDDDDKHGINSNYNSSTNTLPKPGEDYAVDFNYSSLSATNLTSGTSIQLFDFNKDGVIDDKDLKDARTILNTDGFANNQDGGNLGKALQRAAFNARVMEIPGTRPPGDYIVRVTALVAGLASTTTQTISLDQKIKILANCNSQ